MSARPVRVTVLAASPVYYQTPLYRLLARDPRIELDVLFASTAGIRPADLGFGRPVVWDVDALGGFEHRFLARARVNPTAGRFLALRDLDVVGEIRRRRPDVLWLHGYYSLTHVLAALTQRALGGAVLIREEQTLLSPRPRWKRAAKRALFGSVFAGAHALAIGTQNARWFAGNGIGAERTHAVPYAVDTRSLADEASRLAAERDRLRERFGVAGSAPVFVAVGRLVPEKQPLHLLEAFRRARSLRPCRLLVVGSGPLEGELRDAIAAKRVPDVVLAGFVGQSEIASVYAAADAFVLPSRSETWGIAANEAMSFGLPVVVSDRVGCAGDLVVDGETGLVVPFDDVDALAARLGELAEDPALRGRLGDVAQAHARSWTYERAAAGARTAIFAALEAAA